jgi:DNA-binding MarR family transcriptional regulator
MTHRLFQRTYWKLQRTMRIWLEPFGLTPAQYGVLVRINEEGVPLTKTAEAMYSDLSTVNGIVNRLEREGYVRRERCTSDRRVVFVKLTKAGLELRERVKPLHRQGLYERYSVLTPDELAQLTAILRKLAGNL